MLKHQAVGRRRLAHRGQRHASEVKQGKRRSRPKKRNLVALWLVEERGPSGTRTPDNLNVVPNTISDPNQESTGEL